MEGEKQERIRERAYKIWEEKGYPHGSADDHWYQACREVEAEMAAGAERPATSAKRPRAPRKSAAEKTEPSAKTSTKSSGTKAARSSSRKSSKT